MFEWRPLPIAGNLHGVPVCYLLHGTEIVRLSRLGGCGDWRAILDQHRPWEARRSRSCASYETGRRGVEVWAARHADRLLGEVGVMRGAQAPPEVTVTN